MSKFGFLRRRLSIVRFTVTVCIRCCSFSQMVECCSLNQIAQKDCIHYGVTQRVILSFHAELNVFFCWKKFIFSSIGFFIWESIVCSFFESKIDCFIHIFHIDLIVFICISMNWARAVKDVKCICCFIAKPYWQSANFNVIWIWNRLNSLNQFIEMSIFGFH